MSQHDRVLHVISVLSNPERYRSRERLFERFIEKMLRAGVRLTIVELTYDDRITQADKIFDRVLERMKEDEHPEVNFEYLRTRDVMWHKEQLINYGFSCLPKGWKYAAWVDADIEFLNPAWDDDTINALNHFDVVQCWSHAQDLDLKHRPVEGTKVAKSFMAANRDGDRTANGRYDDHLWHPGYAWAIRRDAYDALGGIFDQAILGAGDRHMAMALVGKGQWSYPKNVTQGYKDAVAGWQERAEAHIHRNVGCVDGLITHWWHGSKKNRRYHDRWQILVNNKFNPATDLRIDPESGLYRWTRTDTLRMMKMRDDVRAYFRSRDEDDAGI